jgi:hypothetical protein
VNRNYTKSALLYQNILEYFNIHEEKLEQRVDRHSKKNERKIDIIQLRIEPSHFTTWNLTKWLLKKILNL